MKLRWKVHPAGWIFLALMLAYVPAARLLAALLGLMLHEAGHIAAMKLCGIKECTVELTPFGGVADAAGYHRLAPGKKVACVLGGLAASGVLAAVCLLPQIRGNFTEAFLECNLTMLLLNLLPVWPLDGARLLLCLAEKAGLEKPVMRATVFLGYLFAASMFFLGIYGVFHGIVNPMLFLLPPYMCYASYQSAIFSRIRSMDGFAVDQPVEDGEIRPVKAFAACGMPAAVDTLRMLEGVSPRNMPILYIFDGKTGQISQTLTQKQIRNNLFSE